MTIRSGRKNLLIPVLIALISTLGGVQAFASTSAKPAGGLSKKTSNLHIQVALLRSPDEEFNWGIEEIGNVESATAAAVKFWNTTLSGQIKLTFLIDKSELVSQERNDCSLVNDQRAYLRSRKLTSLSSSNILLILNASSNCAFNGTAQIDGKTTLITKLGLQGRFIDFYRLEDKSKFNALFTQQLGSLVAHELGHNLGLLHSATLTCPQQSGTSQYSYNVLSKCSLNTYGDPSDVMGSASIFCPTASSSNDLVKFSWAHLASLRPVEIRSISKSGRYEFSERAKKYGYSLQTRFGRVVAELVQESPAEFCNGKNYPARNSGVEFRILGSQLTGNVGSKVGLDGDSFSIQTTALNKFGEPDSIFTLQDIRFQPGDQLTLPGGTWKVEIQAGESGKPSLKITQNR